MEVIFIYQEKDLDILILLEVNNNLKLLLLTHPKEILDLHHPNLLVKIVSPLRLLSPQQALTTKTKDQ